MVNLCHFVELIHVLTLYSIIMQGRRRLLEIGTAIEHRWCSPSADGTRGGENERRSTPPPPPRKGGLGDLPQGNFVIQDD